MKALLGVAVILFAFALWATLFAPAPAGVAPRAYQVASTPTLPPQFASTPQAAQAVAQATIAAGQAAVSNLSVTATAVSMQMAQAQATEQAAAMATQQAAQARATSLAAQATTTVQAATSTAQALAFLATGTAQVVQTTATAQVLTAQGTATAQVLMAQATALSAQAEREALSVDQQRMMNSVWAVTKWIVPMLLFVTLVLFLTVLGREWKKLRVVHRQNGKVLILVNGNAVYDPDRNPTPILTVANGRPALPAVSEDVQAATTARDQIVALAQATGRKPPANTVASMAAKKPLFRVVQPGEKVPEIPLDHDTIKVLDAKWREAE